VFAGAQESLRCFARERAKVANEVRLVVVAGLVQAWIETDRLGILQAMGIVDPSLGQGPASRMMLPQRAE